METRGVDSGPSDVAAGPSRRMWALLLISTALLALLRNLPWSHLAGYDQAKQAYASLEIVQVGRAWYPLLPTGRPATKPPLMGWISAALHAALGGWWDGAWRLPSLLAFAGALWLVGRCAAAAGGNWGAFAAAGVLGLNMFSIRLATLVRTDMLLALEVAAAGCLIWRQARTAAPWTLGRRAALAMVVLAGCMTKGPVIFAILLPPLLVLHALRRTRFAVPNVWPGAWVWLLPAAVLAVWLYVGWRRDPTFFTWITLRELGSNFAQVTVDAAGRATATARHFDSVLTYPLKLLHRLLPWSAAMIAWAAVDAAGRPRLAADPGARWLLAWTAVALLAMSLVPDKRADRIFPLVPPIALLAAHVVRHASRSRAAWLRPERAAPALAAAALVVWGGYVGAVAPVPAPDAERSRREFADRVLQWERAAGESAALVGPLSEADQSLAVHLRRTVRGDSASLPAWLGEGRAVIAPLDMLATEGVEVIVAQEPVPSAQLHALAVLSARTASATSRPRGVGEAS